MHVAIDYTSAVHQGAGIGRYTRNLVRALAELDVSNQYTLFIAGGWGEGDALGSWPDNYRVRSVPLSDRLVNIFWQRLRMPLPIQIFTGGIDLFHSPDFVLPPVGRAPALLTVHDLSFLRVPEHFVPGFRAYLEGAVSRGVGQACHILADSQNTRRDLIELMCVSPDKVSVVYPGVEARFRKVTDEEILGRVRGRYGLPQCFILGLGTLQPRKNFDGLIRAFRQVLASKSARDLSKDPHLVICGGLGWMYKETLALVEHHGLKGRVHFTGFVADEDLPALYSLASAFAFPSWYEGFGLPVLEAMACGTPVVVADNSSLPEVVGTAGLMVSAADRDQLAEALLSVITDESRRSALASAGRVQAANFTWEKAAKDVHSIYQRFAARG